MKIKKLLSIVLSITILFGIPSGSINTNAATVIWHNSFTTDNFEYTLCGGGNCNCNDSNSIKARISDYSSVLNGVLEIPETIKGYPVTEIRITTNRNNEIKVLKIPKLVESVNLNTSSGYENFIVDEENKYLCSVDGVLYNKSKTNLIKYPSGNERTTYEILPGVTTITGYSFSNSANLKTILIPDSVRTIKWWAFSSCTGITNITLHKKISTIESSVFNSCTNLSDIYYTGTKSGWNNISISSQNLGLKSANLHFLGIIFDYTISNGNAIITGCDKDVSGSITVPSTLDGYPVTSIDSSAFANCSSITSVFIPNTVTSISAGAFTGCSSLEKIIVEKGNTIYHSSNNCVIETENNTLVFGCKNSVIPNGVVSIGANAFANCTSLTDIFIPNTVTSIGTGAFSGCSSLTNITMISNITSIGANAFRYCSSLANITIPNSVASIGAYTFMGCNSLISISIPASVNNIGIGAFRYCSSLTNISIPNSVTSIGSYAFTGCDNLTIYCDSNSYAENYAINNNIKYITENTVGNLTNQETINSLVETDALFNEIAINHPIYLKNDAVNTYNGLIEEQCYKAIDDYSSWDIVRLATMEGFFKGTEVITSELLSLVGKNSKGDEWIEEATLKFLQDIESEEMVIYEVWEAMNESYKDISFVYDNADNISKLNLAASIAEQSEHLSNKTIKKIVDSAYDQAGILGISDAFDITGRVFDVVDLTIYSCQLYDAEIETINRLLEFAPENTTLYEGLIMIKKAREIDPAAYVISAYLKKEIASGLGKLITKFGKYATSKLYNKNISVTMAVVQLTMDVFYDYLYTGVKVSDVNKAIILKEFHLTLSNALTQKHTAILKAYNNKTIVSQDILDDYKFLWEARTASLGTHTEACADIAKDEGRKSILNSYDDEAKQLVGFENYVKLCMNELNKAISNGTVVCKHYRNYPTRKVQSTCSSEGYTINYCLTCCKEYVSEIDAIDGHTYTKTVINPTCESQGYTNYTCKNCRYSYNTNYTSAKGHTFTETTVKSTCLVRGYTNHKCTTCGYAYNDNFQDVLGHSYSGWKTEYDSTCNKYGREHNDCSICSNRIYANIQKKEHTPSNNWVITKKPTAYEEGLRQKLCSVCGEVAVEETIAKLTCNGDTTGDGNINASDLLDLQTNIIDSLFGTTDYVYNIVYDMNGDGKLDLKDLVRLKKYLAGFDVQLGS